VETSRSVLHGGCRRFESLIAHHALERVRGDRVFGARGELGDALQLANIAAGIVVGKLGAATASPEEITHELAIQEA